jgi:hypothetical protein
VAIVAGLVVPLSAGLKLARPLRVHAASTYSSIVLGDGPAAYWRLGETSGATMSDSGTNGNNGTYTGGYTLGQSGPIQGDTDTAVLFNGSSGYGLAPNSTSLSITGALTLEAWVKLNSTAGLQHILNKGDGLNVSNSAWELGYAASVPGFYVGTFYWRQQLRGLRHQGERGYGAVVPRGRHADGRRRPVHLPQWHPGRDRNRYRGADE